MKDAVDVKINYWRFEKTPRTRSRVNVVPLSHGSQPGMALLRMLSFYHRTHAPENSASLSL